MSTARRALLTVTGCLALSGCMAWHAKGAPETYLVDHVPGKARVTLTDGQVHLLESVRVTNDSLIGFETDSDWNGRRIAAPLDQVFKLEVREVDAVRSIAWTAGMIAFLAIPTK